LLDPDCENFATPSIEGVIGYRTNSRCAVAFGDPVCAQENVPELAHAFHTHCKGHGKSVIYVAASSKFTDWAMQHICQAAIEFGKEFNIDPQDDPAAGAKGRMLRKKVHHASHEGTNVYEYKGYDADLEKKIEDLGVKWLKRKADHGRQLFLSHIDFFHDRSGRRWLYALQNDRVVGVLVLSELQAFQGWLVYHLIILPDSPHGTSELLLLSACEIVRNEGCRFVTFGAIPSKVLGEIRGLGNASTLLARMAYRIARPMISQDGRRKYFMKFLPTQEPSFLLLEKQKLSLHEILAVIKAFNG
jgi:lysylphosphatidylglycerol synthetase-like protein (DUF2156 family)